MSYMPLPTEVSSLITKVMVVDNHNPSPGLTQNQTKPNQKVCWPKPSLLKLIFFGLQSNMEEKGDTVTPVALGASPPFAQLRGETGSRVHLKPGSCLWGGILKKWYGSSKNNCWEFYPCVSDWWRLQWHEWIYQLVERQQYIAWTLYWSVTSLPTVIDIGNQLTDFLSMCTKNTL